MPERARGKFACGYCGSPEIVIPANPTDAAIVSCGSCDKDLAIWGTLRVRLEGRALEVSATKAPERISLREL
jgi:hypothetical protein